MPNFLLVGNGAREHAVAEAVCRKNKMSEGGQEDALFALGKKARLFPKEKERPQTGGEVSSPAVRLFAYMSAKNPAIVKLCNSSGGEFIIKNIEDGEEISKWAKERKIDLAFPSPDAVLAAGVVDALQQEGIKCAAPTKAASRLEWDKNYAREIMSKNSIEGCPKFKYFGLNVGEGKEKLEDVEEEIIKFVNELGGEAAIKPCGLTGGKGVKVTGFQLKDANEACAYAKEVIESKSGGGLGVIIEQKLIGEEFSLMAFCDGKKVVGMPMVQDHKRAYEGDEGPNCGGMGSYSGKGKVLPFLMQKDYDDAMIIMQKICNKMREGEGIEYKGIMYGGFIATKKGVFVIEINSRFGDPEAMNVLPILQTPLYGVLEKVAKGELENNLQWEQKATVVKYLVPQGYPGKSVEPSVIKIDFEKLKESGAQIFYASVNEKDGKIYSGKSRSIAVLGIGESINIAQEVAQKGCGAVSGKLWHRNDIGTEALLQKRFEHMRKLRG